MSDYTPLVYWNAKLTHNGVTTFRTFEDCHRKTHARSLQNLLNNMALGNHTLAWLVSEFKEANSEDRKCTINDQAIELLSKEDYDLYLTHTRQARHLNPAQSRRLTAMCNKLSFYSQDRIFASKKSGKYTFRIAFLSLGAPGGADPAAIVRAFNHFLDYLQRTANCVYVWKKELGETHGLLHFHVMINNIIPYYIVSWKWKRLLIAEGIEFPLVESGGTSNAHSRIELPRNKKQVSKYISKYMSKAYDLPGSFGYISGHSSILNQLKEVVLSEGWFDRDELNRLTDLCKVIYKDYVTIICVNLLFCQDVAPKLAAVFEKQYIEFSNLITLPQKFQVV